MTEAGVPIPYASLSTPSLLALYTVAGKRPELTPEQAGLLGD